MLLADGVYIIMLIHQYSTVISQMKGSFFG